MNKSNPPFPEEVSEGRMGLSALISTMKMRSVAYGNRTLTYAFEENTKLKAHYITVEKGKGVVLKGKAISMEQADAFILKKAAWIIEKLELVRAIDTGDIQTGSRFTYLGRSYYVSLHINESLKRVDIEFTHSKFNVYLPTKLNKQVELKVAFEYFKRDKAKEKLTPRIKKWAQTTGLEYTGLTIKKLHKQWGTCSPNNYITLNVDAITLPYSLIDYLIVHELVHTKIKNHTKEFWAEVSKYLPHWKELDERMGDFKI
ncbi:MAG: M48 family metallopeptidase [Marinilabiliaceae bacterium]|nr:M48 family metallopeptidase [Marinilabiliaceae bacterium]